MIQFDSMEAFDDHDDAIRQAEQERIIKLLENPVHHNIQSPDIHKDCYTCVLVELIKGEQKPIHTHEIEVFGSPCYCGTRHEYCGECDWVEPCEPEGEQK